MQCRVYAGTGNLSSKWFLMEVEYERITESTCMVQVFSPRCQVLEKASAKSVSAIFN
jgi:hypothetical protein